VSLLEESFERALIRLHADLAALGVDWALVGGLAVTFRSAPRFTRDIDLAVAVVEGADSDRLIRGLRDRGYRHLSGRSLFEADDEPLRELRFNSPEGVRVDLILAWSGIEHEIVESAELFPTGPISVPVCRIEHLLATKIHAHRDKDGPDARGILQILSPQEIVRVRELLDLIARRSFVDGRKLQQRLTAFLDER
jgi:hypothetical protein